MFELIAGLLLFVFGILAGADLLVANSNAEELSLMGVDQEL